mmetsp:Transcript_21773/g.30458  ORF Transcript_21773/g.30458 Transcript_21773/m.30458 type:complete len:203 (-) Transcript_21773:73-681(-)|eukprot:CAMPEP_0168555414 /NCGR_PEP_ID=MMETSP0413-20121227/8323_1 /TAXON_ID=136452 /ORGANISM="Filamoeba nolandi, Strain NC-AS-23-1" /LENGTH=202 /DNA_ID=CAMNT_0008586265 /DNA_START=26 /DNA_END=634 /DNA_ORIENTATION=-
MAATPLIISFGAAHKTLIAESLYKLYETLHNMETYDTVQSTLEELDVQVTLQVIEAVVKEIPDTSSEAVAICIKNIESCIKKIETILAGINKQVSYHNTKWFSSWRPLQLDLDLAQLKKQKTVLDQRVDLLMKVLAIHKVSAEESVKQIHLDVTETKATASPSSVKATTSSLSITQIVHSSTASDQADNAKKSDAVSEFTMI